MESHPVTGLGWLAGWLVGYCNRLNHPMQRVEFEFTSDPAVICNCVCSDRISCVLQLKFISVFVSYLNKVIYAKS